MSALGFVAFVVTIFFLIGIGVGVIAVISLAVTRRDRTARWAQLARRAPAGESGCHGPSPARGGVNAEAADEEIGYDTDDCDDTRPHWPDSGYQN
ncbi:MAG TPA: hypothetical protein VF060_17385 [Trebonia sp.]